MFDSLEWMGYVAAALLAVPLLVLSVELFAALLPAKRLSLASTRPSVAVIVPAHDEESGLSTTLLRIREQLNNNDRLMVIADNCTDATAAVGRAAAAEVFERFDSQHRGKGYALAFGVEQLRADPRPVMIVIDADSEIQPGAIDALVRTVAATGRPAQAINLLNAADNAGPPGRLAAFAFFVKNAARPRGLNRLGLPCLLYGTGMAIPWEAVDKVAFAGSEITEDIRLAADLALAGFPPVFCPHPGVVGRFPELLDASKSQRRRWEHGHLGTIRRQVPKLFIHGVSRAKIGLIGLAFHLGVPPLALLFLVSGTAGIGFGLLHWIGPALVASAALGFAAVSLGFTWLRFGRSRVSALDLLCFPWYVLAKLALYGRFLWRPERNWVRTDRSPLPPKN